MEETKLLGVFLLKRTPGASSWKVHPYGRQQVICQVEIMPVGGVVDDPYDFANPHKAYKVTADDFPGVGHLEQVVRGEDLYAYLESAWRGRTGQ